ncbi:hypothetical protein HDU96_003427, partial [Phlyctochytrium bullatum]
MFPSPKPGPNTFAEFLPIYATSSIPAPPPAATFTTTPATTLTPLSAVPAQPLPPAAAAQFTPQPQPTGFTGNHSTLAAMFAEQHPARATDENAKPGSPYLMLLPTAAAPATPSSPPVAWGWTPSSMGGWRPAPPPAPPDETGRVTKRGSTASTASSATEEPCGGPSTTNKRKRKTSRTEDEEEGGGEDAKPGGA